MSKVPSSEQHRSTTPSSGAMTVECSDKVIDRRRIGLLSAVESALRSPLHSSLPLHTWAILFSLVFCSQTDLSSRMLCLGGIALLFLYYLATQSESTRSYCLERQPKKADWSSARWSSKFCLIGFCLSFFCKLT